MGDRARSWASLRGDASPTYGRSTGRPASGYAYGGFGGTGSVFGSYGDEAGGDRGGLGLGGDAAAGALGGRPKPTLGVRDTRGR